MTDHFLTHGPASRCPCGRTVYASDGDCHARCEVCRQVREIGEEIGTYGVCVECIVKWIESVDWDEWAEVREAFDAVLKGRQVDDIGIADLERLYLITGGGE